MRGSPTSSPPIGHGVALAPTLGKCFDPPVGIGQTATLTVPVTNNSSAPLTAVSLSDTLPVGLAVVNPADATTTCGGAVSAEPGGDCVTLSGATVSADGRCTVRRPWSPQRWAP